MKPILSSFHLGTYRPLLIDLKEPHKSHFLFCGLIINPHINSRLKILSFCRLNVKELHISYIFVDLKNKISIYLNSS